jgi:hypothetical protein
MRIVKRLKATTPPFFKKVRNIGLIVAGVGTAIATLPVSLPASLIGISSYLIAIGTTAATIAQTAEQR